MITSFPLTRSVESIPKLGVVQLCLSPTALNHEDCPEVLRMDLTRLLGFQNGPGPAHAFVG
jgi:hypothetical protein